ncbi:MAG TPA: SDR family oxidoreductase [Acidimicrobiales bacterium]|nr:SDR family oxidoreductase [Acidimicrobiales bacterium]
MDREKLHALFDVRGRTAIVTGGTRGIGRAIAEGLACAGADVVVASRKADACRETEARLRELGAGESDALGVPTHLGDVDAIAALVDATVDRFGGVDIVVNNAANALALPIGGYTVDAWEKSMAVNLRGPAFLVERALPHLTASAHGAVLNVISVGAFLFSAGTSMYAAGKAGLLALTRSQAAELAGRGIRANALAPGTVMTDMVFNNPPERVEAMAKASLLRRGAQPDEMVGPALFLVSDASSFMTGQVLIVDGGLAPH